MWFSLVFSIWFPMRAASCLMHSVRKAMGRGRPKNAVIGTLRNLIITVWLIVVIVVSLVLTTVGRRALAFVSGLVTLPAGFVNLWSSLRFVLLGVAVFSLLESRCICSRRTSGGRCGRLCRASRRRSRCGCS